jgi:hypothetical protein
VTTETTTCAACAQGDRSGIFDVSCPACARRLMARAKPGAHRRGMAYHLATTAPEPIAFVARQWLLRAEEADAGR